MRGGLDSRAAALPFSTMMIIAGILIAGLIALIWAAIAAPMGCEDADGFHRIQRAK